MSDKDLNEPDVGVIAQEINSLDLGSIGPVTYDYSNMSTGYGADTITIDSSTVNSMYSSGSITLPTTTITNIGAVGSGLNGGYYVSTGTGSTYNWSNATTTPKVNITGDGIDMQSGTDIKIDGKSLKNFMDKMEERLAILVPDPAKLEKFEALKKAYEHYKLMESLCQEQPKEED